MWVLKTNDPLFGDLFILEQRQDNADVRGNAFGLKSGYNVLHYSILTFDTGGHSCLTYRLEEIAAEL